MNRIIDVLYTNQLRFVLAGTVIGTNYGVYDAMKIKGYTDRDVIGSGFFGGFCGTIGGLLAPIVIPIGVMVLPGYAFSKYKSTTQLR